MSPLGSACALPDLTLARTSHAIDPGVFIPILPMRAGRCWCMALGSPAQLIPNLPRFVWSEVAKRIDWSPNDLLHQSLPFGHRSQSNAVQR